LVEDHIPGEVLVVHAAGAAGMTFCVLVVPQKTTKTEAPTEEEAREQRRRAASKHRGSSEKEEGAHRVAVLCDGVMEIE